MSFGRRLEEYVVGRITFPLVNWQYNRRGILAAYTRLLQSDMASAQQLARHRVKRLRRVLAFAQRRVPWYRERFAEAGFEPGQVGGASDLEALPILQRADVTANLSRLVDSRCGRALETASGSPLRAEPLPLARFRRQRLIRMATTGSTGTPAVFIEDGSTSAVSWAHELRLKNRYGIDPGVREARLRRVANEGRPSKIRQALRRRLWNQLALPGLNLTPADHRDNLRRIEAFQPRLLWGCTTTLVRLAEFIQGRRHPPDLGLQLVVTWSEPLLRHQRELLESVFGCPCANLYGTREVGHIAGTCPEGALHVNEEDFLLETIPTGSSDGARELLVTTLFDTPMPFIRYRVGDLGRLGSGLCSCGRSLAVLEDLSGRAVDPFVTSEQRTFSGGFWSVIFAKEPICRAIRQFQTVYRADGGLRFRIVPNQRYDAGVEAFIRDYVKRHVQADLPVEFEYPADIPPEASGKSALLVDER